MKIVVDIDAVRRRIHTGSFKFLLPGLLIFIFSFNQGVGVGKESGFMAGVEYDIAESHKDLRKTRIIVEDAWAELGPGQKYALIRRLNLDDAYDLTTKTPEFLLDLRFHAYQKQITSAGALEVMLAEIVDLPPSSEDEIKLAES